MDALDKEKAELDKENEELRKNLEEHIQLEKQQKKDRDQVNHFVQSPASRQGFSSLISPTG